MCIGHNVLPGGDGGPLVEFAFALVVVDLDGEAARDDALNEVHGAFVVHGGCALSDRRFDRRNIFNFEWALSGD